MERNELFFKTLKDILRFPAWRKIRIESKLTTNTIEMAFYANDVGPFELSIPLPIEHFCYRGIPVRTINPQEGSERILQYGVDMETYEQRIVAIFADCYEAIAKSSRSAAVDSWAGFHILHKSISDYINCLPLECFNGAQSTPLRLATLGTVVQTIDSEIYDVLRPMDKMHALLEIARAKYGKFYFEHVSDVMRCDGRATHVNLQDFVPFSRHYHHPKRVISQLTHACNLTFSDTQLVNYPYVITKSDKRYFDGKGRGKGITGFVLYINAPETYEDAILVNKCLKNVCAERKHKCIVSGTLQVKPGDVVDTNQILACNTDDLVFRCQHKYDSMYVESIENKVSIVAGHKYETKVINLTSLTTGRNGRKYTNSVGGKGVGVFSDDMPIVTLPNGKKMKAHFVMEAKTPLSRKNYDQLIECMYTNTVIFPNGEFNGRTVVVPDNASIPYDELNERLQKAGYNSDSLFDVEWKGSKFRAFGGWQFIAVIEDPNPFALRGLEEEELPWDYL